MQLLAEILPDNFNGTSHQHTIYFTYKMEFTDSFYNNLDQQWLTVSITLITALVSMKLLFFTENWALHVKRDNSCFSHLIIPSKSLKVYSALE